MEKAKSKDEFNRMIEAEIKFIQDNPQEFEKKFDDLVDKEYNDLEKEKQALSEAFEYQRKYLIEEVLDNGDIYAKESETRTDVDFATTQKDFDALLKMEEEALRKKSIWRRLLDYIFK